jgi:hypothetical protein
LQAAKSSAIHDRHHQVEQDQIRAEHHSGVEGFKAIPCRAW